MNRLYGTIIVLYCFGCLTVQAQTINFASEYDKIVWPVNLGVSGGLVGDDGSYKRLSLFHGHSISLQTGSNIPSIAQSRLYIDAAGNIGIGTTSPATKLHIVGGGLTLGTNTVVASGDGQVSVGNTAKSYSPTSWTNAFDQTTFLLNAAKFSTIGFHDPSNSRVDYMRVGNATIDLGYDGGWGRAHIGFANGIWNSSGYVGIGTTSPSSKLQLKGGGMTIGNNIYSTNTDGHLSLGNIQTNDSPTPSNWLDQTTVILNAQNYSTIGFLDAGHNRVDYIRAGNGTIQLGYNAGWGSANIGFTDGIWNASGNVGIGTTNPGAYRLAVEGKIGAREVEVKTGSWADFVFQPDYRLRPLSEVESYLQTYKHLPEIPSEAEVKANGINLGEMNIKLLQKIEELTLYSIQLEKGMKVQEQAQQKQQMEIQELKELVKQLMAQK